jgi:MFS family permease
LTVAAVGEAWCFALNAASFLAVLAGLMMIRLPPWHASPVKGSLLQQAADGFAYCISIMPLRAMFLMVGVLSFAGAPYTMLMPVFAEKLLGGNAATVGLLMAANGLGALFGALLLASRKSLKGSAQRIVLASILFGGALIGFAWSHSYTLSLVMLVAVGFAMITLVGSCNTMIQSMVSEDYRGRVMAVYAMVLFGFAPFGSLLAGKMSEHWGAPLVVTGGALCCVVSGLVLQAMLPAVREQARALMAQRRLE